MGIRPSHSFRTFSIRMYFNQSATMVHSVQPDFGGSR